MKLHSLFTRVFALFILVSTQLFAAPDFLPPEKAFRVEATWLENANQIEIEFLPAKGYYIYQESLKFQMGQQAAKLGNIRPSLPPGVEKFDETFGKKLQVYKEPFLVFVDTKVNSSKPIHLEVTLQGCAEAGICYPPMTLKLFLSGPGVRVSPILEAFDSQAQGQASPSAEFTLSDLWRERDDVGAIGRFLENASTHYLFLAFFVLGLALAFTPCVLPMLPILSSVIFGAQDGKAVSKGRASVLALSYVFGMALIYALAGVLMAALGGSVQRVLQSPIALIAFAALLLVLSGSLFGLYDLRLPQAWHQHIDRLAGRQKGGSVFGAFALGGISTLVASPCITAPLAGVLAFIAQTGSMSLGASLLFVMALGMGLPLFFIAIEARILIPSTGIWMLWLQRTLGVLLVATAAWIASPIFEKNQTNSLSQMSNGQSIRQVGDLSFVVIHSPAELDAQLAKAKQENKFVMLDFYADWCISCKEMEVNTFANPEVSKQLKQVVLVQADVTANGPENQALLKKFGLYGPPGILFFNQNSEEQKDQRVVGYMSPERFTERLKQVIKTQ
ncbi:protein-disulfide reductase DsbD [Polynucleobacter sp. MWH-UH25E]|uniref:protein-disulfide reductase DsbD n=1 Tax=Polynucleobacter sp. MWH-UH25E TaxID=1855616 RepID=UPI001BFD0E90|nr:protein-disulfide reductase DsbD [Polynucleobacter sp. MWH-UH25E]QWD62126.1 protein-disulfide reductase DsbD [Polynucleobacter sp. MWH-UH25E]